MQPAKQTSARTRTCSTLNESSATYTAPTPNDTAPHQAREST
jgi:hypothetical protein